MKIYNFKITITKKFRTKKKNQKNCKTKSKNRKNRMKKGR